MLTGKENLQTYQPQIDGFSSVQSSFGIFFCHFKYTFCWFLVHKGKSVVNNMQFPSVRSQPIICADSGRNMPIPVYTS